MKTLLFLVLSGITFSLMSIFGHPGEKITQSFRSAHDKKKMKLIHLIKVGL